MEGAEDEVVEVAEVDEGALAELFVPKDDVRLDMAVLEE